jgi:hypothetical protein
MESGGRERGGVEHSSSDKGQPRKAVRPMELRNARRLKLRHALAALGVGGALVAGGVALGGCGASATLDPIARAAEVSRQQNGVQIAMSMQLSAGAQSFAITASGSFDERSRSGQMTMDLSGVPGIAALPGGTGNGQVRMVMLYPDVYMNMPFLAGKLPEGKTWMKLDLTKAAAQAGLGSPLSSLEQDDPTRFLEYLRGSSGGVVSMGSETVDGVSTTHYHGTLQLSRVLERLPTNDQAAAKATLEKLGSATGGIPVDVWIDAQNRVRRIRMNLSVSPGSAGTGPLATAGLTIDFKSYGPVPPVVAPPAGEVFDATSAVGPQLGAGGA